jgi:hypothetical protein
MEDYERKAHAFFAAVLGITIVWTTIIIGAVGYGLYKLGMWVASL